MIDGTAKVVSAVSAVIQEPTYVLEADAEGSDFAPPVPLQEDEGAEVQTFDWAAQRVILPEDCTRAQACLILMANVPLNDYGFPMGYIRSDLLPFELGLLTQGDVDAATERLTFHDGYPQTPRGGLFWSQLDHEGPTAYELFRRYLRQPEEIGLRVVQILAEEENKPLAEVMSMSREYLWTLRSKAHDLFQAAAERKRREFRIRTTENKHYNLAGELLEQVGRAFADEDWVDNITPVEAMEILEKLVRIQRLSLGLTGQNSSSMAVQGGETVEVIMRQLVGAGAAGVGPGGGGGGDLQALMSDPEFGMKAQELIIRATRGVTPITTNQDASL